MTITLNPPQVAITDGSRNRRTCSDFAEGCGGTIVHCRDLLSGKCKLADKVATYGILRGSGEVMKQAKEFWYIDHGYIGRSVYFRITHNALWHNGKGDYPSDRLDKILRHLHERKKNGSNIVLAPPSGKLEKYLGLQGWTERTIEKIKKYTDRRIVLSFKRKNPMKEVIKDAWVVVTDHSNSAIDALIQGVPIIMTNPAREYGQIEDIEDPLFDRNILNPLSYNQWTLAEIKSGQAWRELTEREL